MSRKEQTPPAKVSKDFAAFEKHGKGFGLKMLMQMGYQPGQGLGKEGKGTAEPIEVKLRPKNAGLNFGDFEEKTTQARVRDRQLKKERGQELDSEEDEEEEEFKNERIPRENWKKDKLKKPKVVYKTVDEVLQEAQATKIIDMTGPQARELEGFTREQSYQRTLFDARTQFPELRHNLKLIVDLIESDIHSLQRKIKQEKDRSAVITKAAEEIEERVKLESHHVKRTKEIVEKLSDIKPNTSLDDLYTLFDAFKQQFAAEYKRLDLYSLAVASVWPKLKTLFVTWSPLEEPASHVDRLQLWMPLLTPGNEKGSRKVMSPYDALIYSVWLPRIRTAFSTHWNVRDFGPATTLLNCWAEVIPPFILVNICDQLILPRLNAEVANWDPRRDSVPIHTWLHPWLPILGNQMQPLMANIRYKMISVLEHWQPSDPSANAILLPWKGVFLQEDMDALLGRAIMPKLTALLRSYQINPANQSLDEFYAVLAWGNLLPASVFLLLWVKEFFPKWLSILYDWLGQPTANYEEITEWYLGWKGLFPAEMLAAPAIANIFQRCLHLMNIALSDPSVLTPANKAVFIAETTNSNFARPAHER